jgi:diamine N-acetyltransferase
MNIDKASFSDIKNITLLVIEANKPIAYSLGITPENGPSHPSNCKDCWIEENMNKGEIYFICSYKDRVIGTIAYKIKGSVLTMKHLAVLPKFWGLGLGSSLVNHIFECAKSQKVSSINIGLIDDNSRLKEWYKSFGFSPCKTKKIQGLPYRLTFMKKSL